MTERDKNLKWWKEAKLGLFIHWGLYSILGQGEWVMYFKRIPVGEYEKLAAGFHPERFDADEWVRFAKENGMKYIVITAKHHDGFSMFRTKVSPYNIVDATPFGRDPLAELAEACRREGLKLGFYYSHVREWRHPKAASLEKKGRGDLYGNYGNFWDYPSENRKNLQAYIDEFDMPQIKELLTQYGDVLTIWFDTPSQIMPEQGMQLKSLVYETQNGCLVNSRLSEEIETDYMTMADDAIPASGLDIAWETPVTTHNGWGYVENAEYVAGEETIRKIAEIASKGGNLLINVGPDANGLIPDGARREFRKIGAWLKTNGDAVYGTTAAGFPYKPKWGYVTRKGNSLYLIINENWKGTIALTGLESRVERCILAGNEKNLVFVQSENRLEIAWENTEFAVRTVRVTFAEKLRIRNGIYAGEDGSVELAVQAAELHKEYPYSKMEIRGGITELWTNEQDYMSWKFETQEQAEYELTLVWDAKGFWGIEDLGHELCLCLDRKEYRVKISDDFPEEKGIRYISAGNLMLCEGIHELELRPEHIVMKQMMGLRVRGIQLEKIRY